MISLLLHLYRFTRRSTAPRKVQPSLEKAFRRSQSELDKFWSRFPEKPGFAENRALDLGCGLGAMVFDIAEAQAALVVGLDIHAPYIKFTHEKLEKDYSHLKKIVNFYDCHLSELDEGDFDIIISKDTFEHIIDIEACLQSMATRLRPDGRIFVGFSPLWRSIRGDHHRTRTWFPWGHVIFPEQVIIRGLREIYPEKNIKRIEDLGLNKLSLHELKAILARVGLRATYLHVNVSENLGMKLYNLGRFLPGLAEYFTHNVYMVIEKTR